MKGLTATLRLHDATLHAREMLLLSLDLGIIDEEEFVLLDDANSSNNVPFDDHQYDRFSLEEKDASECTADFRVEKNDIPRLADALGIPPVFRCYNGTVWDGI